VERNQLLAVVIGLRDDEPLAVRVALQAMLPGLWNLARRFSAAPGCVGPARPWRTGSDLDFDVVALASGRLAGPTVVGTEWPAVRVIDGVRDDLRSMRRAGVLAALDFDELDERWPAEDDCRTAADRVTALLIEAVAAGIVSRRDAAALYSTKVLGHPTDEIAELLQYGRDTIRQRRCRALRRLAQAVAAGDLAVAA
jgi:hypothetical protein